MKLDDALPGFIAESADLLRDMEAALLECTSGSVTPESINLIFRSAHTIKGSAGLFGLDDIVAFVHVVETVLDEVRLNRTAMNEELIALLLSCKDHIQSLVALVGTDALVDSAMAERGKGLLAGLQRMSAGAGSQASARTASESAYPAGPVCPGQTAESEVTHWQVSVRFGPGVLTEGMDPLGFIRYLSTFCEPVQIRVLDDTLPEAELFDAESCYLGFQMDLRTHEPRARIEGAFDFVREDCRLEITEVPADPRPEAVMPAESVHSIARSAVEPGSQIARVQAIDSPRPPQQRGGREAATDGNALSRSVRVDAAKLDSLITRIGELIIAAAGVNLLARRSANSELEERTSTLASLVEQVREGALQLRMVKIGATFDRFKRVVHDVSRELDKDISLVVHGEDTELDKTVVEQIGDPLTHLVRNAMDHGIEPADIRTARGKPPGGTMTLNAFHDSGSIVIEVRDDGGGLRRDKILAKAHEKGLIPDDRVLTDPEIFNLVFEPGFSTADAVTNLSGRGVGMDVVKRNITALRGTVGIHSVDGQGTTVTVRLPLTLAIINGFQVAIGKSNFVLPLESIEECIEFREQSGHDFTNLRGQVLPFIRLRELVGTAEPPARRPSIVVVKHAGRRAGIVVDALLGEFQTVINPLGRMFRKVDYVSGSSILGTGEVALILDVPALVQQAVQRARNHASSAA
jgi:two-component system chemotaxis sensor kinase CheA